MMDVGSYAQGPCRRVGKRWYLSEEVRVRGGLSGAGVYPLPTDEHLVFPDLPNLPGLYDLANHLLLLPRGFPAPRGACSTATRSTAPPFCEWGNQAAIAFDPTSAEVEATGLARRKRTRSQTNALNCVAHKTSSAVAVDQESDR